MGNEDSKLIFYFIIHLITPCKDFGRNENLYCPKDNVVVHCSNYDKWFYRKQFWPPSLSSDNTEEHQFSPEDLRAAMVGSPPLKKKKYGKQYILLWPKMVRTGSVIVVSNNAH